MGEQMSRLRGPPVALRTIKTNLAILQGRTAEANHGKKPNLFTGDLQNTARSRGFREKCLEAWREGRFSSRKPGYCIFSSVEGRRQDGEEDQAQVE